MHASCATDKAAFIFAGEGSKGYLNCFEELQLGNHSKWYEDKSRSWSQFTLDGLERRTWPLMAAVSDGEILVLCGYINNETSNGLIFDPETKQVKRELTRTSLTSPEVSAPFLSLPTIAHFRL